MLYMQQHTDTKWRSRRMDTHFNRFGVEADFFLGSRQRAAAASFLEMGPLRGNKTIRKKGVTVLYCTVPKVQYQYFLL